MKVFLTGATGFIGSRIVPELIQAGHQVLGLTRSEEGAKALRAAGAEPHHGTVEDLESLRSGARQADGVIHTAFNHDFSDVSKFAVHCESDRRAVDAMGEVLAGSGRPFVVTSGTRRGVGSRPFTEETPRLTSQQFPRMASEEAAEAAAQKKVAVSIMGLPQVHNTEKQGLVSIMIQIARQKGVSAYVGEGKNRWPAVHVSDAARLYRLALEKGAANAFYHAVDEEGVAARDIAEAVGKGLGVPAVSIAAEEAMGHFGFLGLFVGEDLSATSELTQKWLGWKPVGVGMLADLARMDYSRV